MFDDVHNLLVHAIAALIVTVKADLPRLGTALGLYLSFAIVECLHPAEEGHSAHGRMRNLMFTGVYLLGGFALTALITMAIPLKPATLPDGGLAQSLLILCIYLLAIDVLFYWYHRAEHRYRMLWAIHELHHSDTELNATSSWRSFWLEMPLQAALIVQPVLLLVGVDESALIILPFVLTSWVIFTHANIPVRLGPLTVFICGPQTHRIHHSALREHRDKNFAQLFPFIDVLFGTYYAPQRDEFPPTGTGTLESQVPIGTASVRPLVLWGKSIAHFARRVLKLKPVPVRVRSEHGAGGRARE